MRKLLMLVVVAMLAACTTSTTETSVEVGPASTAATTAAPATTTATSAPPTTVPPTTLPPTTAAPATTTATTTAAPATTAPPTTTASTAGGPFVYADPQNLAPPDPLDGSDGASGSGCAPGSDDLPDGIWFGFVEEISDSLIIFDLACLYFGEIAWEKAAEVDQEAPNDVWITNQSFKERLVPYAADAQAWPIDPEPSNGHFPVLLFGEWPVDGPTYGDCPGEFCVVWLYVNDGVITDLVEQYLP